MEDNRNKINFDEYEKNQTPLAVWGMGSYAKQLLANTRLSKCNVLHLVDGDSKKWGGIIGGSEVKDPNILKDFNGTILITSALYVDSIKKQIQKMGLNNTINVIK